MPSIATTPEQSTPPSPSSRDHSQPPTTTAAPPTAAPGAAEGAGAGVANPPPVAPDGPKGEHKAEQAGAQHDGDDLAPPDAPQAHTYVGEDGKLRWVQYCEEP